MKPPSFSRRAFLAVTGALPAFAAPPQQPPISPNPDLVNLHGFMEWLAEENAPRMSFLAPRWKSVEDWKREARPLFRERLLYDPKPVPLDAEVIGREERDGFRIEKVRI